MLYVVQTRSSEKGPFSLYCKEKNIKRPSQNKKQLLDTYKDFLSGENIMLDLTWRDLICWDEDIKGDGYDSVTLTIDMRHIILQSDLVTFSKKLVNRYSFALFVDLEVESTEARYFFFVNNALKKNKTLEQQYSEYIDEYRELTKKFSGVFFGCLVSKKFQKY